MCALIGVKEMDGLFQSRAFHVIHMVFIRFSCFRSFFCRIHMRTATTVSLPKDRRSIILQSRDLTRCGNGFWTSHSSPSSSVVHNQHHRWRHRKVEKKYWKNLHSAKRTPHIEVKTHEIYSIFFTLYPHRTLARTTHMLYHCRLHSRPKTKSHTIGHNFSSAHST